VSIYDNILFGQLDTTSHSYNKGGKREESLDVHLLGMPIPIYISVNEDERVGGNPGLPRNKTCSNAFHQGRERE
jgi:hypothetical protein